MKIRLIVVVLTILCLNSFSQKNSKTSNETKKEIFSKSNYNNLTFLEDKIVTFPFENKYKSETVKGLFSLNQDTMIVKTSYKNKNKNTKKNKKRIDVYYAVILTQQEVVEITNSETINKVKELISNDRQRFTRLPVFNVDNFTKKTSKGKVSSVKTGGGQALQAIISGDYIHNTVERTALYLNDINDTLIVISLKRYHAKWDNAEFRCSIESEKKDIKATYGIFAIGKDISHPGQIGFEHQMAGAEPFANTFGEYLCISPNGEYGIFNLVLFDIKLNKYYNLNKYDFGSGISRLIWSHDGLMLVNIRKLGGFSMRNEIRTYTFNEEWTKKLTEETNMEAFLAARNKSSKSFESDGESIAITGGFIDSRDAKVYGTVNIGDQTWMTDNMNFGEMITGKTKQQDNSIVEKYCYDNNEDNCRKYGALYQWNEAMLYNFENSRGICPENWHIPSIEEWNILIEYLGGKKLAGGKMKKEEQSLWKVYSENSNISGFSAVPSGYRSKAGGGFGRLGVTANIRTSTNGSSILLHTKEKYAVNPKPDKAAGFSVRCLKD